jgi:inhibitor of growth protein 3
VLATLLQLQSKLNQLIDWVQDPRIGPEQRFQLLQEIAEEAARYKLGADDKVRVAGGASEGVSVRLTALNSAMHKEDAS